MLVSLQDAIEKAEVAVTVALTDCGVKEYAAAIGLRPEDHRIAVDTMAAAYLHLSELEALSRRIRITDVADVRAQAARRIVEHVAAGHWDERRAERNAMSRMVPTRNTVLQIGDQGSKPPDVDPKHRDRTTRAIARRLRKRKQ